MLSPVDYFLWGVTLFFEGSVIVCSIRRRCLRRYLTLNLYMAASVFVGLWRFKVLLASGFGSNEYAYFYYYSDALLTIALYFALMGLYVHVFEEMGAERYVQLGAALLLAGTGLVSYLIVAQSKKFILGHFAVELSQNLYFVGLILTYLLWGAVFKLRETRARLVQLVLSLGVYFSAFAANYALRSFFPNLHMVWGYVPPIFGTLLPLAWAYAFLKLPEDLRLVPAQLALNRR